MKLVIDSNVLFTFFWKNSVLNEILSTSDMQLFSPEYALLELKKHESEILHRTKLSKSEFNKRREELAAKVSFIPLEQYTSSMKYIISLAKPMPEPEQAELLKDIDFIALAIELQCPLWSNDKLLKKQSTVSALSTEDILEILA